MAKEIRLAALAALLVGMGLVSGGVTHPAKASAVCAVSPVTTATIQAAVKACANGGTVEIPAGTFSMTGRVAVASPETITGAGPTSTHLIQTVRSNIFQITAPGVTVENLDLNTLQNFPGIPPIRKNPVPGTLFSNSNDTHLLNLDSEAGTGFGMRLTGPNPCYTHTVSGDTAENIVSTNLGTGGFTPLDFDCAQNGTISNVTLFGASLSLFDSSGVTLTGLTVHPDIFEKLCAPPLVVTGPASFDSLVNVLSYGGHIVERSSRHGVVTNVTITNFAFAPGDTCK